MAKCEICGTKIGGMLGAVQADKSLYDRANAIEFILPENICVRCAEDKIGNAEYHYKVEKKKKSDEEFKQKLDSVFVSPMPIPDNMEDCGLITGYSILGTGPLTSLTSSWTDFFGVESNSYHSKIKEAENFAIVRMKLDALKMGCSAIYMIRVSIQEATSGHGQIMVSILGSAARNK